MTEINWDRLMEIGVQMAERKSDDLDEQASYLQERADELKRWRARDDMNHPRITFDAESHVDSPFEVFIPPFLPNHFEGEAILAPFGTCTWRTWDEAKAFHDSVLEEIEAGKYNETWKG